MVNHAAKIQAHDQVSASERRCWYAGCQMARSQACQKRNSYLYVVAQSVPIIPPGQVGRPTFKPENVCSTVLAFFS